jgi:hypothetical protein
MPSLRVALERLKWELSEGRGEEKVHITFVERDQAERIKNDRRVTRFQIETKDPDVCSELHAEWERIMKRVHNKSVALSLCIRAWREGLSDAEIDRIMAEEDANAG